MSSNELNRRDFHRLSMAAMGGIMAGAAVGCQEEKPVANKQEAETPKNDPAKPELPSVADGDKHLCRGLNACKGKGGGPEAGKNACAGQGECATVPEQSCGGKNECKGLGGCGDSAGANECKGKGGCHVPLMDFAWKKVRKRFEDKMKADKKPFGEAPPAKKK